jgi:hypothetical protein
MKNFLIVAISLMSSLGFSQSIWSNKSRILPDKLREVPVGIIMFHTNNPNYPELNDDTLRSDAKYVWKHSTMAISKIEDLFVVEAGSYIWYNESGWKENMSFSAKEFERYFKCGDATLKVDAEYIYEKNYRYGNQLYGGDALWYILAKDKSGRMYKGLAIIETESQLKKY